MIVDMNENHNILNSSRATHKEKRGIILHPAAIGDGILTLPLAKVIKDSFKLDGLDFFGNIDYISFFPGRTCIDTIYSVESFQFYKLFTKSDELETSDIGDLIEFFEDYAYIVSILESPHSDFQQNLITVANHNPDTEVITLSSNPSNKPSTHLTEYYIQQFVDQYSLLWEPQEMFSNDILIKPTKADAKYSRKLLNEMHVDPARDLVVLHPGSGGRHKCWHLDNYITIAQSLLSKGFEVIFLLGPAELERYDNKQINDLKSTGRCLTDLSLTEALGILSCTDIFIGNDSGIAHLAAGLGIRTISVWGPSDPSAYKPIGPSVKIIISKDPNFAKGPSPILQQELLCFI
jgi:heptosyltransferase-3